MSVVTQGFGPGAAAGSAFSLSSVNPTASYIDLLFSYSIAITGVAADFTKYSIVPTGGGSAITITGISVVAGAVRLTTTGFTNGAAYNVILPGTGFSDGNNDVFQGPFLMAFTGVGVAPTVLMARSVDARLMEVIFSKAVLASEALLAANYAFNNGLLALSPVVKITDNIYRVTTSHQVVGQAYTVTVTGVHDLVGNLI